MYGFHHKNQSGLELKIVLPIENGEEPKKISFSFCCSYFGDILPGTRLQSKFISLDF